MKPDMRATCLRCVYDRPAGCEHPDQPDLVKIVYNGRPTWECYSWGLYPDVHAEAEAVVERALEARR